MPNSHHWCSLCGKIFNNITNQEFRNHTGNCSLKNDFDTYLTTLTQDERGIFKGLLVWFNSFKTLQEYLKNDKDITQINRMGFYHEGFVLDDKSRTKFEELRERERERERAKMAKNSYFNLSMLSTNTINRMILSK